MNLSIDPSIYSCRRPSIYPSIYISSYLCFSLPLYLCLAPCISLSRWPSLAVHSSKTLGSQYFARLLCKHSSFVTAVGATSCFHGNCSAVGAMFVFDLPLSEDTYHVLLLSASLLRIAQHPALVHCRSGGVIVVASHALKHSPTAAQHPAGKIVLLYIVAEKSCSFFFLFFDVCLLRNGGCSHRIRVS